MRRGLALLALATAGLIAARGPDRVQPNPSAVIAAEIAFNRLAQEKGQWTAFRETAAKDAVMFVPQRVLAQEWLKGRADPPRPVRWSPERVYVACDGNLAASTGSWRRPDGGVGYFTTIWRRDPKKERWRWIADHGDTLAAPRPAPEFLVGKVATCKRPQRRADMAPGPAAKGERPPEPPDDSLLWSADVAADGSRTVAVSLWNGSGYDRVIEDKVAAPAPEGAS
ncbi:MAG: hypothetical protein QHC40_09395 [Sphingobium sp.]|nr:hypothetical protein [Sphingobium sp.]